MSSNLVANRWAAVPFLLMSGTLAFSAMAVTLAVTQPGGSAAEPDYYRRGVAYDQFKRQLAENGALGWVVTPEVVGSRTDPRSARLELAVADKHAVPIESATVTAEIIPIRDADRRVQLELPAAAPGRYAADVPLRTGGQWEIRVEVRCKDRVYADRFRRQVLFGPKATALAGGQP